jgi:hypothetical protein
MLDRLVGELGRLLLGGGVFLTQLLNYQRILDQGLRHLPLNFREGDEGEELVFLRLMKREADDRITFFPTTLELDPEAEEPVSVKASRRVPLRPWVAADLVPRFQAGGFAVRAFGNMEGGVFDPAESTDLVLVATRE